MPIHHQKHLQRFPSKKVEKKKEVSRSTLRALMYLNP